MADYIVKSKEGRKFSLLQEERLIGELNYKNWFSYKAEILFPDYSACQIEPKGFWGTTIELTQNEMLLLTFKMHWDGSISIKTAYSNNDDDYVFKMKDTFNKSTLVLLNTKEQSLLTVSTDINWGTLHYNYSIITSDLFETLNKKDILLMAVIHAANFLTPMTTKSGTGTI